MSRDFKEEFKRLRREHARLHDPVGSGGVVELVPEQGGATASRLGGGPIVIEPAEIVCRLDAFYDRGFELTAPRADRVELIWRRDGESRRAVMDRGRQDRFAATVGMRDGFYHFAYEVDRRTTPDASYAQRLLLRGEGAFAPLRLVRYGRALTLRNVSPLVRNLWVESASPWIEAEEQITLPPGGEQIVNVLLLPELMDAGENRGGLRVGVWRTGDGEEGPDELSVPVSADLSVGGAVPVFTFRPSDLRALVQGREHARLEVEVEAHGRGTLRGMITLAHTSEVADFVIDAEAEPRRFSHAFDVDSARLPCRERGAVTVTLLNDCYLADRRLFRVEVPYRLTYLKKSLPVMNFGPVRRGSSKAMRLEIARSDGEEVELDVILPESAGPHLEWHVARPGVCVFRFRAPSNGEGMTFGGDVILIDRRSGLQDRIRFMAEAEPGAAERDAARDLRASTARR